jgi:hypothetical protein
VWQCTASIDQPGAVADYKELAHANAQGERDTSWGRTATAPLRAGHEHLILRLLGDSPTTLLWSKGPTLGIRLAPHHRIKVQPASLYRVSEDSVRPSATQGLVEVWWASYTAALSADHQVPFGKFCIAFRGHHLSPSTMHRKLSEFLDLRQGNHSIYEDC